MIIADVSNEKSLEEMCTQVKVIANRSGPYFEAGEPVVKGSKTHDVDVAAEPVMSRLDIVIFGATGFTGKFAVGEITKLIKKYPGMTWGVAGRSQKKLEDMMDGVSNKTGDDLSKIKVITADVKDEQSLKDMCSQAKIIANCCGPYLLYGEPVVKAAVESKTHYVDISGEPQAIPNAFYSVYSDVVKGY